MANKKKDQKEKKKFDWRLIVGIAAAIIFIVVVASLVGVKIYQTQLATTILTSGDSATFPTSPSKTISPTGDSTYVPPAMIYSASEIASGNIRYTVQFSNYDLLSSLQLYYSSGGTIVKTSSGSTYYRPLSSIAAGWYQCDTNPEIFPEEKTYDAHLEIKYWEYSTLKTRIYQKIFNFYVEKEEETTTTDPDNLIATLDWDTLNVAWIDSTTLSMDIGTINYDLINSMSVFYTIDGDMVKDPLSLETFTEEMIEEGNGVYSLLIDTTRFTGTTKAITTHILMNYFNGTTTVSKSFEAFAFTLASTEIQTNTFGIGFVFLLPIICCGFVLTVVIIRKRKEL